VEENERERKTVDEREGETGRNLCSRRCQWRFRIASLYGLAVAVLQIKRCMSLLL
jgi:hypothetical protein